MAGIEGGGEEVVLEQGKLLENNLTLEEVTYLNRYRVSCTTYTGTRYLIILISKNCNQ